MSWLDYLTSAFWFSPPPKNETTKHVATSIKTTKELDQPILPFNPKNDIKSNIFMVVLEGSSEKENERKTAFLKRVYRTIGSPIIQFVSFRSEAWNECCAEQWSQHPTKQFLSLVRFENRRKAIVLDDLTNDKKERNAIRDAYMKRKGPRHAPMLLGMKMANGIHEDLVRDVQWVAICHEPSEEARRMAWKKFISTLDLLDTPTEEEFHKLCSRVWRSSPENMLLVNRQTCDVRTMFYIWTETEEYETQ